MSGNMTVAVRRPADDIPVEYLSEIRDGDCACWKYYDFDASMVTHFVCKTWGKNQAGKIEIHLDDPAGELLGTCEVASMDGEVAYAIHETEIKPATGKRALVLVFKAASPASNGQDLMNLEWFTFENRKK